jgi:hypothetical protein
VTPGDFQIQMRQRERLQDSTAKEKKFDNVQTPAEIARILCSSSLEIEADEAFIEKCRQYLWARLKCPSSQVDLLFKTE